MKTLLTLPVLALLLVACGGSGEPSTAAAAEAPAAAGAGLLPAKIKFKAEDGSARWELKPKDDGAKLVDGAEQELARYTVNPGGKLIVKGPDDVRRYEIEGVSGKWRATPPDEERKLFVLQRQDDGDWKLEDGAEQTLYKIKRRDYGWKIVDAREQDVAKVKLAEDGKRSLRDPAETTLLYTRDPIAPLAMTLLAIEELPLELRAGFALRLQQEAAP